MDPDRQARIDKIKKFLNPDNRRVYLQSERLDTPLDDLPSTPLLKTAGELMAEAGHLPPMLVEGLLPDHSLFLLTGKPKAGKSFLALDIADCVSKGQPVLGALNVSRPGPVIYLALEDGQTEIARRLTHRGHSPRATSHQQPVTSNLYFITEPFTLTDPHHFARFRAMVQSLPGEPAEANRKSKIENRKSTPPSLIVIDTAAEALDIRDWINRAEILSKIAPLRKLARELCTVLLVAHNRKADGDMGDEIAGSNALAGAVDGWISAHKVERRPNGNRRLFLRVEGRGGVGSEMAAEMDHNTLHFSCVTPEQAEAEASSVRQDVRAAKRQERRQLAHKTFHALGNRATIAELAAAMGIAYSAVWPLVRNMAADGDIEVIREAHRPEGASRRVPTYRLTKPENTLV